MKRGCPDEDGKGGPKRLNNGKDRAKPLSRSPPPPVEEKEEPDEDGAGSVRMAINRERDLVCLRVSLLQAFIVVSARMAMLAAGEARNLVVGWGERERRIAHYRKQILFVRHCGDVSNDCFNIRIFFQHENICCARVARAKARLSEVNQRIANGFDFEVGFRPFPDDVYLHGDVDVSHLPPQTFLEETEFNGSLARALDDSKLRMDDSDQRIVEENGDVPANEENANDRLNLPPARQIRSLMDFHRAQTFVLCLRETQPCCEPQPPCLLGDSNVDSSRPVFPEPDCAEGYFPGHPEAPEEAFRGPESDE
jgi:hypothetical protein